MYVFLYFFFPNDCIVSDAHCPDRPDEQLRIEEAKGWITEEKELFVGRLHRMDLNDPDIAEQAASGIQWTTIYRVLGEWIGAELSLLYYSRIIHT
jgi:hypothetical protein